MSVDRNVILFGTSGEAVRVRSVQLGPLSFVYTADSIRRICWHGIELVRAIAWPIRDENWGTLQPVILEERIDEADEAFSGHLSFSVADRRMVCTLSIKAASTGELNLNLSMTPSGGAFATNRAGFTVLHPIKGIAGEPLQVTHSDGAVEATIFPRLISAAQPVFDIQRLVYGLDGKAVDITFGGEVFEMEDQRNWSDASYKTYCVPLVFPFTYEIESARTQSIRVSLSGDSKRGTNARSDTEVTIQRSEDAAPAIGLAIEPGWMAGDDVIAVSGVGHLVARVGPQTDKDFLVRLASAVHGREPDLEVVIGDEEDPATYLADVRDKIEAAGLAPPRIIAMRESYLSSYQPSGPWPDGPVPAQVVEAAREAFPNLAIGGGMLTNFTEFNRCPPDPACCDFVTHGSTAIVHASDDLSVCETLEALPQIFESALAIADGTSYRLGLVSIGMRSNPYGAAVTENPGQERRTMAREDPRQRGLFAAAWAVGVLAATDGQQVEALCLAAPSGPFGIAYHRQSYPQAYFDENADAAVYPIFHVIKAAAAMTGQSRLHVQGLPDGVYAYGTQSEFGDRVIVANVTPEVKSLDVGRFGRAAILDTATFVTATTQTDWLNTAPRKDTGLLSLEGYAVAFLET